MIISGEELFISLKVHTKKIKKLEFGSCKTKHMMKNHSKSLKRNQMIQQN